MTLTKRQFEVLAWIDSWTKANGYSRTYSEICAGTGLSSLATVHKHVTNLCSKGALDCKFNRSRSIEITERGHKSLRGVRDYALVQALALARVGA